MYDMMNGGLMWGMGWGGLLVVVVVVLGIALFGLQVHGVVVRRARRVVRAHLVGRALSAGHSQRRTRAAYASNSGKRSRSTRSSGAIWKRAM